MNPTRNAQNRSLEIWCRWSKISFRRRLAEAITEALLGLLKNEHRGVVCDKMRRLAVKTALKLDRWMVRSGLLENGRNSTMAVGRAVPVTITKFLFPDFDRRWLVGKLLSSRIERRINLENRVEIRRLAPLDVPWRRSLIPYSEARESKIQDEVGSRRMMACPNRYDQGNRSPCQT